MRYIGTISSDARGKLGGMVATRARNGTNFKAHAAPVNPRSVYQQFQRSLIANGISAWKALTQLQQGTWSVLAAQYAYTNSLAQVYAPTGMQLWVQAYVNHSLAGTLLPTTAPASPPVFYSSDGCNLVNTAGTLTILLGYVFGVYPGYASYSLSAVLSTGVTYTKQQRRRPMGSWAGTGPVDITSSWAGAYGPLPPVGSNISVRITSIDYASSISGSPFHFVAKVQL